MRPRRTAIFCARGARGAVWLLALLLPLLSATPSARAGPSPGPGPEAFAPVVKAWQAKDAAAVVALVATDGRLMLNLEGTGSGKVSGRPTKENAQAILKRYFEQVDTATLKDATAADAKTFTRSYDYTYRPRGADERTTRLSFTIQKTDETHFALVGAEERPKKP